MIKFFALRNVAALLAKLGVKTTCKTCGKEIYVTKSDFEKSESKNFFCSQSCSAKYSNSHRVVEKEHKIHTSIAIRKRLTKHDEIGVYVPYKIMRKIRRKCPKCGETPCGHKEICTSGLLGRPINLQNIGFDLSTIGTEDFMPEYYRCKTYIEALYHEQDLSYIEIMNNHSIKNERSIANIFQFFKIEPKSQKDAMFLRFLGHQTKQKYGRKTWLSYKLGREFVSLSLNL